MIKTLRFCRRGRGFDPWLGNQDPACRAHTTKKKKIIKKMCSVGFPGGAVVESLPANAGDTSSSPGLGRSHMPRSN